MHLNRVSTAVSLLNPCMLKRVNIFFFSSAFFFSEKTRGIAVAMAASFSYRRRTKTVTFCHIYAIPEHYILETQNICEQTGRLAQ